MNEKSSSPKKADRKGTAILVIAIIVVVLALGMAFRFHPPSVGDFSAVIVDLRDDATTEQWADALASQWNSTREDGSWIRRYEGRRVLVTNIDEDFHGALLKAHLAPKEFGEKIAIAVVCRSTFKFPQIQQLTSVGSFARANDIRIIPVTNSTQVAALFLLSPQRTLIYPWVILLMIAGGACGGYFYALTQDKFFWVVMPFSGERVATGVLGHMSVGAGAGLVLVALAVKGFGLDLEPLFKWPYETDGVRALIQTSAVAIIGGYLGIKLLDQVSEQVQEKLKALSKEVSSQKETLDLELANSLALQAKSLYSTNFANFAAGVIPDRILNEVAQLAEGSNARRKNSLAMAMLAEVKRIQKDLAASISYYDQAISLLPDPNLIKPHNLYFNRACVRSLTNDPRQLSSLVDDLKTYLKSPGVSGESIWTDEDLRWARSQPEFRKNFSEPSGSSSEAPQAKA